VGAHERRPDAIYPRAAGHDYAMWEEEFAAATCWAFGAR